MSVHLQEHPQVALPVGVADDLEAFLHVLLYNATRFLIHERGSIVSFAKRYFGGQGATEGRPSFPVTKGAYIRRCESPQDTEVILGFRRSDGRYNTINTVLWNLFHLFQGRYAVLDYDAEKDELEERIRVNLDLEKKAEEVGQRQQLSSRCNPAIRVRKAGVRVTPGPADRVARKGSDHLKRMLADLKEPSEDEKERCKACCDHEQFIGRLTQYNYEDAWDADDRIVGDRFSKHYV